MGTQLPETCREVEINMLRSSVHLVGVIWKKKISQTVKKFIEFYGTPKLTTASYRILSCDGQTQFVSSSSKLQIHCNNFLLLISQHPKQIFFQVLQIFHLIIFIYVIPNTSADKDKSRSIFYAASSYVLTVYNKRYSQHCTTSTCVLSFE